MADADPLAQLPCPFCGSTNAEIHGEGGYYGKCGDCEAESGYHETLVGAIRKWNTRQGGGAGAYENAAHICETRAIVEDAAETLDIREGKPVRARRHAWAARALRSVATWIRREAREEAAGKKES